MSLVARHVLGAHSASPAIARAHTSRVLGGSVADDRRAIAVLVVSELVTNAVSHGQAPIRLGLALDDDYLRIEVSDADPNASAVITRAVGADAVQLGGRGLRIVDALAERWGVRGDDEGKTVWAEVPVTRHALGG